MHGQMESRTDAGLPQVKPIAMADESIYAKLEELVEGRASGDMLLETMGFGVVNPVTWQSANTLQHADLNYVQRSICGDRFARIGTDITERMICAEKPGKDSCLGDSGGPLVLYNRGDDAAQHLLVGLTSFGSPTRCADPNFPGVYSNLISMRSFIMAVAEAIEKGT